MVLRVVTLASATGRYGGPYDTARRQAILADEAGCEVTLCAGFIGGDRPQYLPNSGPNEGLFRVGQLVPGIGFSGLFSITAARAIVREVRRSDVVHVSYARELVPMYTAIISRIFRKRLVLQPHGMLTSRTSRANTLLDLIVVPIMRQADLVVALTKQEMTDLMALSGLPAIKFKILGNPIPLEVRHPDAPRTASSTSVLFIARLHPRKRVGDFLKAAAIADVEGLTGRYVVIGPDEGELDLVKQTNLKNFIYLGAVPGSEVTSHVDDCGVFALVSKNEPWGNVLVTALALGRPVVVTSSSALASEIRRYDAGIVVDDSDPQQIAEAVHSLLVDESLYRLKSSNALRLSAETLGRDIQVRGLCELYGFEGSDPVALKCLDA